MSFFQTTLSMVISFLVITPTTYAICTNPSTTVVCPDTIAVIAPNQVVESDTRFYAIACTAVPYSSNISIQLISNDRTEIICPQTALLLSGSTQVSIPMTVVDDFIADGSIDVSLSAIFNGLTATTKITVNDNDNPSNASLEKQALSDLYTATSGDQWKKHTGWLSADSQACTWHGIDCDNGVMPVSEIRLNDQNLNGTLPSSMGNFKDLKRLFLGRNQLNGSIPDSLQQTRLHVLWLPGNQLSGSISNALCSLTFLQELNVSANQLTGSLPTLFGQLSRLKQLNLAQNKLFGSLPTSFDQLTKLTVLDMHGNSFSGAVNLLQSLCELTQMDISDNQFSGKLSVAALSALPLLKILNLYTNDFTGSFPYAMAQNIALLKIDVHDNYLSGTLPQWESIGYQLNALDLRSNTFQGKIPESIVRLTRLSSGNLDLRWNALYAGSQAVKDFIDARHTGTGWEKTQTLAPSEIKATVLSGQSIRLDWTPIVFDTYTGAYEIHYAYGPDLPFNQQGETTSKSQNAYTVTGLKSSTTYYFKIRTRTNAHENNRNIVYSAFSDPIALTTYSTVLTVPGKNGHIVPSGLISVPHHQSTVFSMIPDYGYHVQDVLIDFKSVGPVTAYTFTNVLYPRQIHAYFGNDSPTLGPISPVIFDEDTMPSPIPLTIADRETRVDDLIIEVQSDNLELIPKNRIHISGTGSPKYLQLQTAPEMSGLGTIMVRISDPQGLTATQVFPYTVTIINDPPVVKNLIYNAFEDTETQCVFMGLDIEEDAMFYVLTVMPNHGQLTHTLEKDYFLYRGEKDYYGRDYIKYKATDRSSLGPKTSTEATIIMNVIPVNDPPDVHAGEDIQTTEGERVTLDGSKSNDVDDTTLRFLWTQTFGPSVEMSSPQAISPVFIAPHARADGQPLSMIFWLTVTDEKGLSGYDQCVVTVISKDPRMLPFAQIASPLTPVSGMAPLRVNFKDHSIGNITQWHWSFGDSRTSSLQHPVYTYDQPGSYTVDLYITGSGGSDTISKTHWIKVLPNPDAITPAIQPNEREALVDLYNSTQGHRWLWQTNWLNPSGDEYLWHGVNVPPEIHHVTDLQLAENRLNGFLPSTLGQLVYLQQMDLSKNSIWGALPDSISALTALIRINLSGNTIQSTLPATIKNLKQLTHLILSNNRLYGSIPETISQLAELKQVYLDRNQLIGVIPESFSNLKKLLDLSLSYNFLTNPFPDFEQMTALQRLYLSNNQFSGPIPESLMHSTGLRAIRLAKNAMTGNIPDTFDRFKELQELNLSFNRLSGSLPDTLYATPQLMILNLSNNQLEGTLKTRITLLKQLKHLDLSHNRFSGGLPLELTRLFRLEILNLSFNSFGGEIPESLDQLYTLKTLNLSNNCFNDSFPDNLLTLKSLEIINIAGNIFHGTIPDTIRQMTWLKDKASDFRWNNLQVSNRTTEKFISSKQISGDTWIDTQTIAPTGLAFKEGSSWREQILSWEPIAYTADTGGYQIFISMNPDSLYESRYVTHSKSETSYTLTGLSANKTYYCKIRTITYPHANNPNTIYSDDSETVAITVYELIQRPKKPESLISETYYNNRVMVSWKKITTPENVYYQVYRSDTPDGVFQRISEEILTENALIDWDVLPGKDYYYKVRSFVGVTPSNFFSDIIHAVPGFPTTYSISGHFTYALVAQGDTAVYSLTLTASDGFTGKIDIACLWPGEKQSVPPVGLDPVFYLDGYIMTTSLKSFSLPASVQLKVKTAQNYVPSVLPFQLSITDSKTKSPRIFDMILHVIAKDSCDIVLYTDKPVYDLWSLIKASGFISKPVAREPVTIEYLEPDHRMFEQTVLTSSDGFFETSIPQYALIPGNYTVTATWGVRDEDTISCPETTNSVSIQITQAVKTSRMGIYLDDQQILPQLGMNLSLKGTLYQRVDPVNNQTVMLRIYSPDTLFIDYSYDQNGMGVLDFPNITVLSQPGVWRVKGYWAGVQSYPGCESDFLDILVETPPGRAIILGTSYPEYQTRLPNTTHKVCKRIYEQLIQRGFDPVEILTMMHSPKDSPLYPPIASEESIDWIDILNPPSQRFITALKDDFKDVLHPYLPLWIFIHGFSDSKTQIRMAGSYNVVTAEEIDAALDSLQAIANCPVIVVLDMPYSGAFISQLSGTNRIIITSTTATNYFVDSEMDLSFSVRFFEYLNAGKNLFQSFDLAKQSWDLYSRASAQIDDNGDGIADDQDRSRALQTFMNGSTIQTVLPVIEKVSIRPNFQYATSLPVSVTLTAGTDPIDQVRLKVLTPTPHPLYQDISTATDIIIYDLQVTSSPGNYQGLLTCLSLPGTYTLMVVAQDRNGYRSKPVRLTLEADPETPVSYFDNASASTRHTLDTMCGFFTFSDPNTHEVATPTDKALRGVWGLNHQYVIAVGDVGVILFFDGNDWKYMESNTHERLLAVWGNAADAVYAVGEKGVMRHYNGIMWEPVDTNIQNPLCGIWGSSGDNIYAVGGHGTILHYDGTTWERQYTKWYDRLNDIWGRNASDIYAAGENGRMLHFDGISWNALPFCVHMPINRLVGDQTTLFATHFFDPIQFEEGNGWTPTQTCNYMEMNAFWQSNLGHVFTVGERGQTLIWSPPPSCASQNTQPSISPISNRDIGVKQPVPPIPFTVKDAESFPYELVLYAFSSNPVLVPDNQITIQGTGADRLLTVIPKYGLMGQAYISIVVEDPCGSKQASGFLLTLSDNYGNAGNGSTVTGDHDQDGKIKMDDILDVLRMLGE